MRIYFTEIEIKGESAMELLLDKKKNDNLKKIGCGSALHEENTEIIVPDQSPDIMRIIKGTANVFVKDKEPREEKLSVSGNVKGCVLYVAEGEMRMRKIEVLLPFSHTFDIASLASSSRVFLKAALRSFDVREINPRKISVRAGIELSYCAFDAASSEICIGAFEADNYGICTKSSEVTDYRPKVIKEKSFSINDDIELTGESIDMSSLLSSSVNLLGTETKIVGNKAILKGVCDVEYMYETEDGMVFGEEAKLPFSQILDIDGMEESDDVEVSLSVSSFSVEPQFDASGKARYMTVDISAEADISVYEKVCISALCDAYSTMYETAVEKKKVETSRFVERSSKRVPVSVTIEAGNGIKRILDASVSALPAVKRKEEGKDVLSSDAAVSVIYIGEDDGIYSATRRVPIICPAELCSDHAYEATVSVKGKGYSIGAGNEINVRFFTDFDIDETEYEEKYVVDAISVDTESLRCGENTPSVTLRRVTEPCEVWSLAKEYATTAEEIKVANGLSEDVIQASGRMVLIPVKK